MITDINKSAAEKLIALRTEYMTDLFNTGLAQMKKVISVKEPKEVFGLQIKFLRELGATFSNVTEKQAAMLSETKEQLMDVIEKIFLTCRDCY